MAVYHDEVGPLHVVVAKLVRYRDGVDVVDPTIDLSTGEVVCPGGVVGRLPCGPRKAVLGRARLGWEYVVHDCSPTYGGLIVTLYGTPSHLVALRGDLMGPAPEVLE